MKSQQGTGKTITFFYSVGYMDLTNYLIDSCFLSAKQKHLKSMLTFLSLDNKARYFLWFILLIFPSPTCVVHRSATFINIWYLYDVKIFIISGVEGVAITHPHNCWPAQKPPLALGGEEERGILNSRWGGEGGEGGGGEGGPDCSQQYNLC